MSSSYTIQIGRSQTCMEAHHAEIVTDDLDTLVVQQSAGNEPGLMHATTARAPTNLSEWMQALPPSFSDIREGVVGELILQCRQLFSEYQQPIGGSERSGALIEQQKRFENWTDQKDDLDERLNGAPVVRTRVVSNLLNLVLVLSQGLPPPLRQVRFQETRRVIEQASKVAGDLFDYSTCYENINLPEFIDAASNAIKSRVDDLTALSPTIDYLFRNIDEDVPRHVQEVAIIGAEGVATGFDSSLAEEFPKAARRLIARSSAANCKRLKLILSRSSEVDGSLDPSPASEDGEVPRPNSSKPNTRQSSNSSPSFLDSSMASERFSSSNAHTDTTSSFVSTEADLISVGQTSSSHSGAAPKGFGCRLCKSKVDSLPELRKHLLLHIRPYHCCWDDCDDGLTLFATLPGWMNHEFHKHRVHTEWACKLCRIRFDQPDFLNDHISLVHGIQGDQQWIDRILNDSLVKRPGNGKDELCDFCHMGEFKSMDDYAAHVGKHMEEIASRVILHLIPAGPRHLLDFSEHARKLVRMCGRISRSPIVRRPFEFLMWLGNAKHPDDKDYFEHRVTIWDHHQQARSPYWALFDTGSEVNFILRSVVEELGLEDRQLPASDGSLFRGLNNQAIFADKYVVPEWRVQVGRKRFDDIRFIVVDEIRHGVHMLLGEKFIKEYEVLKFSSSSLVIQRDEAGSGRHGQQHDNQTRATDMHQAERNAAIKAQRNTAATSNHTTQTTKSGCQAPQKDTIKGADAERR